MSQLVPNLHEDVNHVELRLNSSTLFPKIIYIPSANLFVTIKLEDSRIVDDIRSNSSTINTDQHEPSHPVCDGIDSKATIISPRASPLHSFTFSPPSSAAAVVGQNKSSPPTTGLSLSACDPEADPIDIFSPSASINFDFDVVASPGASSIGSFAFGESDSFSSPTPIQCSGDSTAASAKLISIPNHFNNYHLNLPSTPSPPRSRIKRAHGQLVQAWATGDFESSPMGLSPGAWERQYDLLGLDQLDLPIRPTRFITTGFSRAAYAKKKREHVSRRAAQVGKFMLGAEPEARS